MTEAQAADAEQKWRDKYEMEKVARHVAVFGRPPSHSLEERIAWSRADNSEVLEKLRCTGSKAEIIGGRSGCPSCRKLHGQVWDIDEALRSMPLPNIDCELFLRGGAGCCFWAMPIPDSLT